MSDYHAVICPHCRQRLVIRSRAILRQWAGRCIKCGGGIRAVAGDDKDKVRLEAHDG